MCVETVNLILLELKSDADTQINSCWCVLVFCILFLFCFFCVLRAADVQSWPTYAWCLLLKSLPPIPLPESMVHCEHLAMILNRLQPARPQRESRGFRVLAFLLWAFWVWHVCAFRLCGCGSVFCEVVLTDDNSHRLPDISHPLTRTLLAYFLPLGARWCECTDCVVVMEDNTWNTSDNKDDHLHWLKIIIVVGVRVATKCYDYVFIYFIV